MYLIYISPLSSLLSPLYLFSAFSPTRDKKLNASRLNPKSSQTINPMPAPLRQPLELPRQRLILKIETVGLDFQGRRGSQDKGLTTSCLILSLPSPALSSSWVSRQALTFPSTSGPASTARRLQSLCSLPTSLLPSLSPSVRPMSLVGVGIFS